MRFAPLAAGTAAAALLAFGLPSVVTLQTADTGGDVYKVGSGLIDTTAIGTLTEGFDATRSLGMAPVAELEVGAATDMQFQLREGLQVIDGVEVDTTLDLAFLGLSDINDSFHGMAVIDITDPTAPVELSRVQCGGFHNDVAVWENFAIIGFDGGAGPCPQAQSNLPIVGPGAPDGSGLYVFDVTDPTAPVLTNFFNAEGEGGVDLLRDGTHNFTVHPDGLVYFATASFDADEPGFGYFDLTDMDAGQTVFSMRDISPSATDGCHDIGLSVGNTYHGALEGPDEVARDLAVCPAIEETYIWDITDPRNISEVAVIPNPAINIHHGGRFTPDGRTVVLGDELAGAGAPSGCFAGGPVGAMFTYDISLPEVPVLTGYVSASESPGTIETCTSHFYNFVPNAAGKVLSMTGWYGSGMVMHDLTPLADESFDVVSAAPMGAGPEVAHLEPEGAELWNAYAYRGYVYANSYTGNTGFFVASLDGYTGTADADLAPYSVDEGIVWGKWTPRG